MKKYKLIKKFPDGPELGQVAEHQEGNNNYYIKEGFGTLHYRYSVRSIEENPEFWEEVKEKEWEIIELRRVDGSNYTIDKAKIGIYLRTLELGDQKYWFIYSIKRLSDGEVFTVGDKVHETVTGKKDLWTIKEFSLKDERCFSCGININNFEHAEILFATEDGIYIYERDKYWTVFNKVSLGVEPFKLYGPHFAKDVTSSSEQWNTWSCKYFSSPESALKYIDQNKEKTVYGVNASFTKTVESKFAIERLEAAFPAGDWKWFNSEKERDLYIEENKPRFSKKDMREFVLFFDMESRKSDWTHIDQLFSRWTNQVRKEK